MLQGRDLYHLQTLPSLSVEVELVQISNTSEGNTHEKEVSSDEMQYYQI